MNDRNASEAPGPHAGRAHDDETELEALRQRVRALRSDWSRSDERFRRRLQQRPLLSVAVAVALGFVAGRVIGRG